jgi:localization factor PodJL
VPRDLAEAYKWFFIAAQNGDAPARESAVSLENKLSATQLAAADKAIRAFRPPAAAADMSLASAQKILGRLGYFKGQATGQTSRDFRVAVQAYQRDQGLPASGAIDPATAARLSVFTR